MGRDCTVGKLSECNEAGDKETVDVMSCTNGVGVAQPRSELDVWSQKWVSPYSEDGPEGREKVRGGGGGTRQKSDELAFQLHSGNIASLEKGLCLEHYPLFIYMNMCHSKVNYYCTPQKAF